MMEATCPLCRTKLDIKVAGGNLDMEFYYGDILTPFSFGDSEDEPEELGEMHSNTTFVKNITLDNYPQTHMFWEEDKEFIEEICNNVARGIHVSASDLYAVQVALLRAKIGDPNITSLDDDSIDDSLDQVDDDNSYTETTD
jgi:hypothetical protein